MDLSIIIVNWNTGNLLLECVNSIMKNIENIKYEIIIVDNASKDDSCKRVEGLNKNIKIIYSKDNLGFAKGNNLAFKNSTGKYVLLLNPDTIVLNRAIEKAYNYIINTDNVLLGAKLLNSDKTIQLSSCKFPNVFNIILGSHPMSEEMHLITHETDWVMGAFMMLRSEDYKMLNGLNEEFFMYSEDLELCYKFKKSIGKVIHFADAEIIHLYNQSGKKKWNSNREEIVMRSNLKFIKNNYKIINRELCKVFMLLKFYVKRILKSNIN